MPEKPESRTYLKLSDHSTNTCEVVLVFHLPLSKHSDPSTLDVLMSCDGGLEALHMFCRLAIFKIH